jgi:hypothetical protein
MNDGFLNPHDPIIEPIKVSVNDFLGYEKTKRLIQSILYPLERDVFLQDSWRISAIQRNATGTKFDCPLNLV